MRLPAIATAVTLLAVAASSAPAATINRVYPLFTTGIELNYGAVIYDPEDGTDPINLTGFPLVKTNVVLDYTPADGEKISDYRVEMLVPVTGAQEEFLLISGDDMTETSPGTFHYELSTDIYDGTIRPGRFSVMTYSMDPDGNPISTAGEYADNSGITLVVETPEPASLAAIGGGLLAFARRRRF
jgi:hypothetical protein